MLLFDDGLRRLSVKYVQLRNGSFFYRRRYPEDLLAHFDGTRFKLVSLKTKSPQEAAKKVMALAQQDDTEWAALRTTDSEAEGFNSSDITRIAQGRLLGIGIKPGEQRDERYDPLAEYLWSKHDHARLEALHETGEVPDWKEFLTPVENEMIRLAGERPCAPKLSDAVEYYLKEHRRGGQNKFAADTRRSAGHVMRLIGDWSLDAYRTAHAEQVRDELLDSGIKTRTVRRQLSDIAAVFAKGIRGFDLQLARHPFQSLAIAGEGDDAVKKPTFTAAELAMVASGVRAADDDMRYIVGFLLNSGARISEIVGLRLSDIHLDEEVPHFVLQPYMGLLRTLKTKGSARTVPLVGTGLWSARRSVEVAKSHGDHGGWLFRRYSGPTEDETISIRSGSAGTALNKWLETLLGVRKTTHSFRHTLRDQLREVGASEAIQDQIGGWGSKSVGQGYGEGYSLKMLQGYLNKVAV